MFRPPPRRQAAWRRVVQLAVGAGIAVPGMTASLAYFDTYRRGRLPANLVQAQRDFFGSHTYERTDGIPGWFHTVRGAVPSRGGLLIKLVFRSMLRGKAGGQADACCRACWVGRLGGLGGCWLPVGRWRWPCGLCETCCEPCACGRSCAWLGLGLGTLWAFAARKAGGRNCSSRHACMLLLPLLPPLPLLLHAGILLLLAGVAVAGFIAVGTAGLFLSLPWVKSAASWLAVRHVDWSQEGDTRQPMPGGGTL
jgi:hypothetical protein